MPTPLSVIRQAVDLLRYASDSEAVQILKDEVHVLRKLNPEEVNDLGARLSNDFEIGFLLGMMTANQSNGNIGNGDRDGSGVRDHRKGTGQDDSNGGTTM